MDYVPPVLADPVVLICGYTPPSLTEPVVLCQASGAVVTGALAAAVSAEGPPCDLSGRLDATVTAAPYVPPVLSDPVILACGYTPPALATPVILCQVGPGVVTGLLLASIAAELPACTLVASAQAVYGCAGALTLAPDLPVAVLTAALAQDLDLPSDTRSTLSLREQTALVTATALGLRVTEMQPLQIAARLRHQQAVPTATSIRVTQTETHPIGCFADLLATDGIALSAGARLRATETRRLQRPVRLEQTEAVQIDAHTSVLQTERIYRRTGWSLRAREAVQVAERLGVGHRDGLALLRRAGLPHTEAMVPPPGLWYPRYVAPSPLAFVLCCPAGYSAPALTAPVVLTWQYPVCRPSLQPKPQRFVIPTRPYYVRIHDLSVVRLPDRTALPWRSITLRTDASLWGWTMSLELIGRNAGALVDPGAGEIVQVEAIINGAPWICLAEDWTESSRHGQWTTTQVTGRGLTAALSGRYQRPRSYTETSARTMAQLAEQELPMGEGWAMTWEPADWPVAAGAWTYQDLSPIEAIARLASDAGALVYASPASQTITVRPVYRMLPWDYAEGQEDLVVPESALVGAVSRRYRYPDQADAVHVYGGEVGGIQARVYRDGSAGDVYGSDRSSPLLTHVDGARALGGRLLAGLATPPGVSSFTMPIEAAGDFPVVRLGDWARVELSEGAEAGPVTSIQISVQADGDGTSVRQTLGLGESTNDYQRLLALMPREPRILGQIAGVGGDGTVVVTTLGGGSLRLRGSGSVGAWVWCRSGRVEDAAPAMTGYEVAV